MLRTSFNTIAAGRGLANWILGFGALVIVLVGSHGFWFYQQQHTAALDRTLIESQNLVRALEEYTSSTVQ